MRAFGLRAVYKTATFALSASLLVPSQAHPQQFTMQTDPRPILIALIGAFQTCGPPNIYQYLGAQLFQAIAMQTGGMGCYPGIAAAGPVSQMQVNNVVQLPAGPVFAVRVTHQSGIVADWYIGLSNLSGRVEYLTFVAASATAPLPDVSKGPVDQAGNKGGQIAQPQVVVGPTASKDCKVFKTMCM